MYLPAAFRSVLRAAVPVLAAVLCSQTVYAQLPPRLKRCLPYPTLADEIAETKAAEQAKQLPARRILIDAIRFQGSFHLPKSLRALVVKSIRSHPLKERPGWLGEVTEISISGALRDDGYFRVDTRATAQTLSEDAEIKHVALDVSVEPGPQYRLGTVRFRCADRDVPLVFPTEELRKRVLLREGEIFDVSKVHQTFRALKDLYASSGWIDFNPNPVLKIDDASKRIDMTLELDQEKQYRVGEVQFLGHDTVAEQMIRSNLKVGEPFDGLFLQRFYEENKSILPPGASLEDDVVIKRDAKQGIANIRIDLQTCPSDAK
jgi:outer membrane translocation and assembly module TamA